MKAILYLICNIIMQFIGLMIAFFFQLIAREPNEMSEKRIEYICFHGGAKEKRRISSGEPSAGICSKSDITALTGTTIPTLLVGKADSEVESVIAVSRKEPASNADF